MHIFDLYRRGLMVVFTVYAIVRSAQSFARWAPRLSGPSRRSRLARGYVAAMLLSIRIRRFCVDLLQIGVLLAILGLVIYSHKFVLEHIG